jgi:putative transposase
MALEDRSPVTGWVHHSGRGVQYAHAEYLRTLRNHGVIPSVSRLGRPYDIGNCERFFRTLEQEEINTKEYKDLEDLRLYIADFIERYYNQKQLDSALGYLSPVEFERTTVSSDAASVADMTQFKI